MKASNSRFGLKMSAVLWLLFFFVCTGAFGQDLSEIRASIKAKGHKWVADETTVSVLPDHEKRMRAGLIKPLHTGKEKLLSASAPATGLSSSVDLVNFVTPVRNQGSCGSCWAFATTAALESQLLIANNAPLTNDDRAEQILLSCSGAGSCSGGYIDAASNYIKSTGLPPEQDFAYTASDSACANALAGWQTDAKRTVTWSYVNTSPANLTAIKTALSTYGPVATTMDVYSDFYYYTGGIYQYTSGSLQGGHAVLIVGYTDDPTVSGGGYFKVKNSWGTGWGQAGYFLIAYSQIGSPVYFGEWTIAYSIPTAPTVPLAPSSLTGTALSGGQASLSWIDNSNNEDGFRIERCSGSGCSNLAQVATVGANVVSYSDTTLAGSTTYTYRVSSYNGGGITASNTAVVTTPPAQPPATPTGLTAAAASSSQVNLSWSESSSNQSGFYIERCVGVGCSSFSQIATVGSTVRAYNNTGLTANTNYTYRVRAYLPGANSDYSSLASATTQCTYAISPSSKSFSSLGGIATVTVTTQAGCALSPVSNVSWISLQGQTASSFTYKVAANTSTRRTGTISVSGKTHTATQSAQGKK